MEQLAASATAQGSYFTRKRGGGEGGGSGEEEEEEARQHSGRRPREPHRLLHTRSTAGAGGLNPLGAARGRAALLPPLPPRPAAPRPDARCVGRRAGGHREQRAAERGEESEAGGAPSCGAAVRDAGAPAEAGLSLWEEINARRGARDGSEAAP